MFDHVRRSTFAAIEQAVKPTQAQGTGWSTAEDVARDAETVVSIPKENS